MFQSNIFKSGGIAWSTCNGRNFLLVPEHEREFLDNIPGWCNKEDVSSAVVVEEGKLSVLEVHSVDTIEPKSQSTVQAISSKEELLKSFLKFEAISNSKGKSATSVIDISNRALSKCKSLSNISNIKAPVLQLTRSSSSPNLVENTEILFSKINCQSALMENINLNQTYTVQCQQLKNNCKEAGILEVNGCRKLDKKVHVVSESSQAENNVNKKLTIDSFDKSNSREPNSDFSKPGFRIDDHETNDEDQNEKSDVKIQEQRKSTTLNGENFQNAEKMFNKSGENCPSSAPVVNENAIELQHNENLNDSKFCLTQDQTSISQEIPCAQPVSCDLNSFSLIGIPSQPVKEIDVLESTEVKEQSQIVTANVTQYVKSVEILQPLQQVMDVHERTAEVEEHSKIVAVNAKQCTAVQVKATEIKEHSRIVTATAELCTKSIEIMPSEPEKVPEVKTSRKRKHTDKSRKSSLSSKTARKADIYYSDAQLKTILSCLKLCLELV